MEPETRSQKVSAALLDVARPWLRDADDRDSYYKALMLAMTAWNLSLMPADKRKAALRGVTDKALGDSGQAVADFEALIAELMTRKLLLYPLDHRFLVDLDLVETSGGYRVNVMSARSEAA